MRRICFLNFTIFVLIALFISPSFAQTTDDTVIYLPIIIGPPAYPYNANPANGETVYSLRPTMHAVFKPTNSTCWFNISLSHGGAITVDTSWTKEVDGTHVWGQPRSPLVAGQNYEWFAEQWCWIGHPHQGPYLVDRTESFTFIVANP